MGDRWNGIFRENVSWGDSLIYEYLSKTFLADTTNYIPNGWESKIATITWNTGEVQSYANGRTIYELEKETQTFSSNIGLIYLSDYYVAFSTSEETSCFDSGCDRWMSDEDDEWTMSYYGLQTRHYTYLAWVIKGGNKTVKNDDINLTSKIRPVFYLNKGISVEGTGSSADQYRIKKLNND